MYFVSISSVKISHTIHYSLPDGHLIPGAVDFATDRSDYFAGAIIVAGVAKSLVMHVLSIGCGAFAGSPMESNGHAKTVSSPK